MDYKVVEEFIGSFEELHNKYPNMEALVYNWTGDSFYENGGMVYAVSDNIGKSDMGTQFKKEHPNTLRSYILTSPNDSPLYYLEMIGR